MTKRPFLLTLVLTSLASPLVGQNPKPYTEFRPKSCAAAESLVGHPIERPKGYIFGVFERTLQTTMLVSADLWVTNAKAPFTAIWVTLPVPGHGPVASPAVGLQMRLRDTLLHAGPDAMLTLQFDDAPPLPIGVMQAQPFRTTGGKIDQVLTLGLTAEETLRLVKANQVTGTVGSIAFVVPRPVHDGMVAVFLAAACGVDIK